MTSPHIGTLREQHMHAALKAWYRQDGDRVEVPLDGFVIDLVRGPMLIEIQTRGFSSMRRKFDTLLDQHPMRLVHPIAGQKWIRKVDADGVQVSRRRSPKRGKVVDVCAELVSFPTLLSHPNFSLHVLLVEEEEIRRPDPKAWRRGGWGITERRLVEVADETLFAGTEDLNGLVPGGLPDPFTTADLAGALGRTRHLAQEVAYCLREAGILEVTGRTRAGIEYSHAGS